MAVEEGEGPPLGPRAQPERPLEKSHVPTFGEEGGLEPARAGQGRRRGQRRGRHEWIVQRIDEQGRPPDLPQVWPAARANPVVALVDEAIERRREVAVVLREGPSLEHGRQIELTVVDVELGADLRL